MNELFDGETQPLRPYRLSSIVQPEYENEVLAPVRQVRVQAAHQAEHGAVPKIEEICPRSGNHAGIREH